MAKPLSNEGMHTAENIFREYLRDRGLKYTPERQALLHEVLSNDEHFEAEQLLIALRQAGKRVAKATVYHVAVVSQLRHRPADPIRRQAHPLRTHLRAGPARSHGLPSMSSHHRIR